MTPFRTLTALPVFNEASHVDGVLDEVLRYADDVLVVDDGSSDETPGILTRRGDVAVSTHAVNQGYGAALRTAFRYALDQHYDILVTIDCDGQHEPRLIPEIAARVFADPDDPIDVVSGSRYLEVFAGNSTPPEQRRRINVEIIELLDRKLGLELSDAFCGFKAYRVLSLSQFDITEPGYAMPLQFWVQAAAAEMRIVEFPVPLVYLEEERSFGGSLDDGDHRLAYYREVFTRELAASACTAD